MTDAREKACFFDPRSGRRERRVRCAGA
jgi:hypothetical protein